MNKKSDNFIFTALLVVAILVVLNFIVYIGKGNLRFDFTEKKLFTLSEGTKRILVGLDPKKPITIRFYGTRDSRLMPQWFQGYAATVEDVLLEFEKASDGKVTLEKIDPRPDTEEEDKARGDDIAGHPVNEDGDKVYFGLAIQSLDKKEIIPALSPNEESSLEYMIARAIAKVTKPTKSVIGVMTPMPIAGPAMNQQLMMMMQRQQQQPWAVFSQLRMDYDLREVPFSTDKIDADIGILIVVHPAGITPSTEFAIDQFLMRGGKLIAFVDPQCAVTRVYSSQGNPMMGQPPSSTSPSSNLKELFKTWGIGYDADQVVADQTLRTRFQNRMLPTFLSVGRAGISKTEPITAPLEVVQMFSPGALSIEKKEGISVTTLLESSENEMLIDSATAEKVMREPLNNFQSTGRKRILGLRLTGHFKSAFPDGPPKATPVPSPSLPGGFPPGGFPGGPPDGAGGAQEDAGAPKQTEKKDAPAAPAPAPAAPIEPAPAPVAPAPAPAAPATAPDAKAPATAVSPPVSAPPPTDAPAAKSGDQPAPAPAASAPAPSATPPAVTPPAVTPAAPAPDAAAKPADQKREESKPNSLKESVSNDGIVFLFPDADMLYDGFCFQQDPLGRLVLLNHNVPLLLNIVEQLNGGADLIDVRSRGSTKREFTKLQELSDAVEKEFRPKLEQLEKTSNETAAKISSLKVTTDKRGNQTIILGQKEKKDLDDLMATQASISKERRNIKKEQNKGKDRLETWITVLNLIVVPLLVIAFGVTLALRRRSLEAAR